MSYKVGHYSFQWSDLHIPPQRMANLRYTYDELGAEAVKRIQAISRDNKDAAQSEAEAPAPYEKKPPHMDMYQIFKENHAQDEVLTRLYDEVHTVPEWVDWDQLQRGQRFFYRYALANIMGFALQGFMGENAASPGTAEVLVRTGGFSTRVLLRRLLETFQLVLQVTHSLESIKPGGAGHTTAIRVRLLHSMVRDRVLKLAASRPEYFDTSMFGVPVNDIDCIHSITTFACNHSWLQLPYMGVYPTPQESADYIALWRYVGYLLGAPHQYFDTAVKAKAAMESTLLHELRVTPMSYVLANNFIQCLTDLPPANVSADFIEAGSRVLNGDGFCDQLQLGRPGLYSYACFRGYCWLVQTLVFFQRLIPSFDDWITDYFRDTLHEQVIMSKKALGGGSKLEFKHVPRVGKMIGKESSGRSAAAAAGSPTSFVWIARPVETFLFAVFLVGCLMILGIGLAGFHIGQYVYGTAVAEGWQLRLAAWTALIH